MIRHRRSRSGIRAPRSGIGRIVLALLVALLALGSYFFGTSQVENPITGEVQRVSMTPQEEIAIGLQAAPQMAAMHGGLYPDQKLQAWIDQVGQRLVEQSDADETEYQYEFHLLADPKTVNAFALPGGQIFITYALFTQLSTEGEVAGVLAHELGHVVARHAAERMAKAQLTEGLTSAAVIAAYDPNNPSSAQRAQMARLVGHVVNMSYSREHELESDRLAVRFMADTEYDPRALIRVMEVLAGARSEQGQPEFLSTHPNPGNRIKEIRESIAAEFPDGVPDGRTD